MDAQTDKERTKKQEDRANVQTGGAVKKSHEVASPQHLSVKIEDSLIPRAGEGVGLVGMKTEENQLKERGKEQSKSENHLPNQDTAKQ